MPCLTCPAELRGGVLRQLDFYVFKQRHYMTVSLKMLLHSSPETAQNPSIAFRQIGISSYTKMFAVRKKKMCSYYTAQYNRSWQLAPDFCCTGKSLVWWQDLPQGAKIWHQCIVFHEHLLFFIVKYEAAPPLTPHKGFLMGISWGISPGLNGNPTMFLSLEYPRLREKTLATLHKLLLLLVQPEAPLKWHFS